LGSNDSKKSTYEIKSSHDNSGKVIRLDLGRSFGMVGMLGRTN